MSRPDKPEFTMPTLTHEQVAVKNRVISVAGEIESLQVERRNLTNACTHVWVPYIRRDGSPYSWCSLIKDWEISSSACCFACGTHADRWYCVKSPTHLCEYEEDDTAWDSCIHCGQPDERK